MKSLTKEWIEKAESDRILAEKANDGNPLLYAQICFHCQQSAEKYLKAILVDLNQIVPKTHNLLQLLMLLTPFHPELRKLKRGLIVCSKYAVDSRYPGLRPKKRSAVSAMKWEAKIREACRAILKIKPKASRSRGKPL